MKIKYTFDEYAINMHETFLVDILGSLNYLANQVMDKSTLYQNPDYKRDPLFTKEDIKIRYLSRVGEFDSANPMHASFYQQDLQVILETDNILKLDVFNKWMENWEETMG